jgi:hypothetical protein
MEFSMVAQEGAPETTTSTHRATRTINADLSQYLLISQPNHRFNREYDAEEP